MLSFLDRERGCARILMGDSNACDDGTGPDGDSDGERCRRGESSTVRAAARDFSGLCEDGTRDSASMSCPRRSPTDGEGERSGEVGAASTTSGRAFFADVGRLSGVGDPKSSWLWLCEVSNSSGGGVLKRRAWRSRSSGKARVVVRGVGSWRG
jgi:hypothetical protein